jgi:hypothetical protein
MQTKIVNAAVTFKNQIFGDFSDTSKFSSQILTNPDYFTSPPQACAMVWDVVLLIGDFYTIAPTVLDQIVQVLVEWPCDFVVR